MAKKRRRVGPEDIVAINEAYLKIGTYAGAGRATGWSGSTVKRYIIPNYKSEQDRFPKKEIEFCNKEDLTYPQCWNEFLKLSDEEEAIAKKL